MVGVPLTVFPGIMLLTQPIDTNVGVYVYLLIFGSILCVAGAGALIVARRREPWKFLLVTSQYVVYTGDDDGVQWARLDEVDCFSAHKATAGTGGYGGGGASTPTYLEIVYKEGLPERLFVDDDIEGELEEWREACDSALEKVRA